MKSFIADLHIHTTLSPCAHILMTPKNIIDRALKIGLDVIAITDHNSAENLEVAMELAKGTPLKVIPGMEVETVEEVHLLCLFDELEQVLAWQEVVYGALPDLKNNDELFGPQILTDLNDNFVSVVERLLLTATSLTVDQVCKGVNKLGGIVIPAHVDKSNYSILSNLGFIPENLEIKCLEISKKGKINRLFDKINTKKNYQIISNSDAHYLEEIKRSLVLELNEVNIREMRLDLMDNKRIKVKII
ncbi:PHP domain-containing protein [Halonatronum saccharophilum]|uniref:PHP domain-containing protein n=1 Tax=Halonatronum saccharophilum TaxID=150060 RepID=UPI00048314A9|nr:PHP domain-containing protein [Halonatronum saccharophilum]